MEKKPLSIVVENRALADLIPSDVNARRMGAQQMDRLVANIERDGCLSSAPLVYGVRIISGHHRVEAGLKAGVAHADCMVIKGDVSEERLTAIQLAHNSLAGEDDPNVLAKMLADLPVTERQYAAVPDMAPLEAPSLGPAIGTFQTVAVTVYVLPTEYDEIKNVLEQIPGSGKFLVEPAACMAEFLETVFATKALASKDGLMANPGMLVTMARLAQERLNQIAGEVEGGEAGNAQGTPPAEG